MKSLTAIILSGGFSTRMGIDKGLVHFRGKPLIEYTLEIATSVTKQILIVANNKAYEKFGVPVYQDILKEKGPLGGIHTGLTHSNTAYNLVLACDMPLMTTAFVKYLIKEITEDHLIIVPMQDDKIEPLCAIYRQEALPRFEIAAGSSDLSLHALIKRTPTKFFDIDKSLPYYSPFLFSNANSKEELEALESIEL